MLRGLGPLLQWVEPLTYMRLLHGSKGRFVIRWCISTRIDWATGSSKSRLALKRLAENGVPCTYLGMPHESPSFYLEPLSKTKSLLRFHHWILDYRQGHVKHVIGLRGCFKE
jgi:hypothetical protein